MTAKPVTCGSTTYYVAPVSLDQAEESFLNRELKPKIQNRRLVTACLKNGLIARKIEEPAFDQPIFDETTIGGMDFGHYTDLLTACLEVNGLKAANSGGGNAAQAPKA